MTDETPIEPEEIDPSDQPGGTGGGGAPAPSDQPGGTGGGELAAPSDQPGGAGGGG
jgi:hypothetical protein